MHLHTTRLGAQQHIGLTAHSRFVARAIDHVERVLHRTAGMIGGRVERREVVIVGFDFRTGGDGVAKTQEHVANFFGNAVDQMARTQLLDAPWQCDIHRRRIDARLELCGSKRLLARLERFLDNIAHFIDGLADGCSFFLGHLAHVAQIRRQRARLADDAHAHLIERSRVSRLFDGGKRFGTQRFQFFDYCHVVSSVLLGVNRKGLVPFRLFRFQIASPDPTP